MTNTLIQTIRTAITEGGAEAVVAIPNLQRMYDQDGDVLMVWYDRDDLLAAGCGIDSDDFVSLVVEVSGGLNSPITSLIESAIAAGFGDLFGADRVFVCMQADVENALRKLNGIENDEE